MTPSATETGKEAGKATIAAERSEDRIVAALLTVALAAQPASSPDDILNNYRKFLSELLSVPPGGPAVKPPGRV